MVWGNPPPHLDLGLTVPVRAHRYSLCVCVLVGGDIGVLSTGGLGAFLHKSEEVGEEEEGEPQEITSNDVIAESMPLPRRLPGESQSVLVAMRTKTRRAGVFPELDSALLQVTQ